jgi:hypothetical protein
MPSVGTQSAARKGVVPFLARHPRLTLLMGSAALHVALILFCAKLRSRDTVDSVFASLGDDTRGMDVELGGPEPGAKGEVGTNQKSPGRPGSAPKVGRRAANRSGRAHSGGAAPIERTDGEQGSCLLSMRGCQLAASSEHAEASSGKTAPEAKERPDQNRLASFWKGPRRVPENDATVVSRVEADGVQMTRYEDGGQTFSSVGRGGGGRGGGGIGKTGLLDLARRDVGGQSGLAGCNPYRSANSRARSLVLIVDTSASVFATGQTPHAVICAAGVALAALARGYDVEVLNFSTRALHQPPTRDAEAVYRILRTNQRQLTVLPEADRLVGASSQPRDFVLITDSAIGNLERTLPSYRRLIKASSGNRALLYLLGDGTVCGDCLERDDKTETCAVCRKTTDKPLRDLEAAGFATIHVAPAQAATRSRKGPHKL